MIIYVAILAKRVYVRKKHTREKFHILELKIEMPKEVKDDKKNIKLEILCSF